MEWLMTRETVRDTPQYYIMTLSGNGAKPGLRQLSAYPHPYPTLRELQKEIIRCATACQFPAHKNFQAVVRKIVGHRLVLMQKGHWPILLTFAYACICANSDEFVHKYMREHELDLTATLYLPLACDRKRDGRLPRE